MNCFRRRLLNIIGEINTSNVICFTALSDSTIELINVGDNSPIVYVSANGKGYSVWNYSRITLKSGNRLYLYGDNPLGFSTSNSSYSYFQLSGSLKLDGDIQCLISQELPTTIPSEYCFYRLFYNCSALSTPPILSATILTPGCYNSMFYGCNALLTMPDLPATSVQDYSYTSMFQKCTSLKMSCQTLPATTLAQFCYSSMFQGCTSLQTAPTLPAMNLKSNCYKNMFYGCENLETAPTLPALLLETNCYLNMFYGCLSLNYVKAMFTTVITSETKYTVNWLYNVAEHGLFYKNPDAVWELIGDSGVPETWTISTHGVTVETTHDLSITADDILAEETTTTIHYIYKTYNTYEDGYIETLTETGDKTSDYLGTNTDTEAREVVVSLTLYGITATTTISQKGAGAVIVYVGYNLEITADNIESEDTSTTIHYTLITTTYYSDATSKAITTVGDTEYTGITKNTTTQTRWLTVSLTMHDVTASTVITQTGRDPLCFMTWSAGSTITINQVGTPTNVKSIQYSIDGETWSGYTMGTKITLESAGDKVYFMSDDEYGMSESSTITKTFAMSGMIAGYGNVMALVNYSKSVPANCFYKLFKGCSVLQTAPSLPAKIMSTNCYREMFANCTSLQTSPDLPALDLINKCYASMFSGCSALSSIKAMFLTKPASGGVTDKWVNGVSSWGTFTRNANASWDEEFGIYAIPSGWSVKTEEP